jgi:predicted enzyme related to lactoylglutathione lyase
MTSTKLKVTGINHVVLHVTDLERSKRFYMEVSASKTAMCPWGRA